LQVDVQAFPGRSEVIGSGFTRKRKRALHVNVQTTYCMRRKWMHVDVQNTLTVMATQGWPRMLHVNVQNDGPRKGRGGWVVCLHVNVQAGHHWRRNGLHVDVQSVPMGMAAQGGLCQRLHVNVY